jgi:endonuclease YncB( thermonuclease family)
MRNKHTDGFREHSPAVFGAGLLIGVVYCFILIGGIRYVQAQHDTPKVPKAITSAAYVRTIDGDTIVVETLPDAHGKGGGRKLKVRLAGIDAPELSGGTSAAFRSAALLAELCEGALETNVASVVDPPLWVRILRLQPAPDVPGGPPFDKYHRELAHVFIPHGVKRDGSALELDAEKQLLATGDVRVWTK